MARQNLGGLNQILCGYSCVIDLSHAERLTIDYGEIIADNPLLGNTASSYLAYALLERQFMAPLVTPIVNLPRKKRRRVHEPEMFYRVYIYDNNRLNV